MEPQAETISDMRQFMSIKEIYKSLEVYMPEEVKYCPYSGPYENKIFQAYDNNDLKTVIALIHYRDAMINRSRKLKELYKSYPEQFSHSVGFNVN